MAPEQATDSHTSDIRADLYSLGCTLYFLLAGRPPFAGGTLAEKLTRHMHAEPTPIKDLRDDVPAEVRRLIRKLMAKRPEERFQTPIELAKALEPYCHAGSPVAVPVPASVGGPSVAAVPVAPQGATVPWLPPPAAIPVGKEIEETIPPASSESVPSLPPTAALSKPARTGRRRLPLLVGLASVAAVVLVVGLAIWLSGGGSGDDGKGGESGRDGGGGDQAAREPGQQPQFDPGPLDRMQRPALPFEPHFEKPPDKWVGTLGDVWGRHWGAIRCVAVGKHGTLAASGGDDKVIRLWDAETLEPRGILDGPKHPIGCVAISPNGRFVATACTEADFRLWMWDLQTKKRIQPQEGHGKAVRQLVFSTDSGRLLSTGDDQIVIRWLLGYFLPDGSMANERYQLANSPRCVALSPDGKRVLSGHGDKSLRLTNLDRKNLDEPPIQVTCPHFLYQGL
jgi:hypothetical protein